MHQVVDPGWGKPGMFFPGCIYYSFFLGVAGQQNEKVEYKQIDLFH